MEPLTPTTSPEQSNAPFRIKALDTLTLADFIGSLKVATESLGGAFGELESQVKESTTQGPPPEIKRFERLLKEQDQIQKDSMAEIHLILKDYLDAQLFEHLKEQAQHEIEAEIDELFREQVAQCLEVMIPQNLQEETTRQKAELDELRKELLNSENRRANALLRSTQPEAPLREIYMSNGEVSERYPKTLSALFDLDADTSKALMIDYEVSDVSDTRDRNLNRFMQFCGVSYQMVRTGSE